jgi:hypothetical protein
VLVVADLVVVSDPWAEGREAATGALMLGAELVVVVVVVDKVVGGGGLSVVPIGVDPCTQRLLHVFAIAKQKLLFCVPFPSVLALFGGKAGLTRPYVGCCSHRVLLALEAGSMKMKSSTIRQV